MPSYDMKSPCQKPVNKRSENWRKLRGSTIIWHQRDLGWTKNMSYSTTTAVVFQTYHLKPASILFAFIIFSNNSELQPFGRRFLTASWAFPASKHCQQFQFFLRIRDIVKLQEVHYTLNAPGLMAFGHRLQQICLQKSIPHSWYISTTL